MRIILSIVLILVGTVAASAQDIVGFPRSDFGNVVLSSKQFAGAELETHIGNYNNEPISNYDPKSVFSRLGGPVGRLDILTNIQIFPCTGFLVSPKYLVTNYHCVPGILEIPKVKAAGVKRIDAVQFVLGYTQEGVSESAKQFTVSPHPVETNKELDYAILEVLGNPSKAFGHLQIASIEPYQNSPLWIIGHPLGEAQRISREQCKSGKPAVSNGRLRHTCDTLPGNSGSPVIDPDSKTVIALHHAGSKRNSINYAVPFSEILKVSPILRELTNEEVARNNARVADLALSNPSGPATTRSAVPDTEWLHPGGDYQQTRYSDLDQIDRSNVGSLRIAWSVSTGVLRGHEGAPLVVDSMMYIVTPFPNNVMALDLKNQGRVVWKYTPRQDPSVIPVMCCDTVNRGLAYADGTIFLHQADTNLVALDARTGKQLWRVANGDPRRGESGTNAPMVVGDKVIVGISGGEFGLRGHVTAYSARDGRRLWRAYSAGPDSDMKFDPRRTTNLGKPVGRDSSLRSWRGDQWKIGGGTAWGWFSYDPELNLIYYGSGNPSTWNPSQRPGDNKWAASIFARDADTGLAKWVYQMTPHDEWSYDGVNEMILADIEIGGGLRKALVHFDKNGVAFTLDRKSGELLVAEKFDPTVNWTTGYEMDPSKRNYGRPYVVSRNSVDKNGEDVNSKNICPTSAGAKNQGPAAYSPKTGVFYVPTNHMCMDFEPFRVSYTSGQPYVGATLSMYPAPNSHGGRGNFIAWDAAQGRIIWSKPEDFAVWSGALVTAGDIVFYGTLDGYFKALDTTDGNQLFSHRVSSGIIGNPITYGANGKQYVAILSGVGGWAGIGLAAGLTNPTDGLGMVGANADLQQHTSLGGQLVVFELP